jgi:hypothetical protein
MGISYVAIVDKTIAKGKKWRVLSQTGNVPMYSAKFWANHLQLGCMLFYTLGDSVEFRYRISFNLKSEELQSGQTKAPTDEIHNDYLETFDQRTECDS